MLGGQRMGYLMKLHAHPHSSENVSVVHNGIIENSTLLKKYLEKRGYIFKSQTDTEVITHLLSEFLKKNKLVAAIQKTLAKLHGSYALVFLLRIILILLLEQEEDLLWQLATDIMRII